ncbi:SLAP domain-containing protein [Lacticaseibacillus pabuli]|uniref:SLAP domain-containing protein n=1 Tax=Lacticaseibacillus pabuli TaxID=3025672 RepID=A0ABY7WRM9_9LACO|nr:SLAP domain-containing protein [Lacticaseibacillus sp. KACC 23028]WDF82376.1 SLAP domain-containing protein [Lacticaseibacillus sp. KACC 23028]
MKIKAITLASAAALAIATAPVITPAINSFASASNSIHTTQVQRDQTTNKLAKNHQDANTPLNRPNRIATTAHISFVPGYSIQVWTMTHTFVYDSDGRLKKLRDGANISIYDKTTVNGDVYYKIGSNQWVDSAYVSFS